MNPRLKANVFLVIATALFGANYVIAKGLMPDYFLPRQIIFIRVLISMLVFVIIHHFWVREKILRIDIFRLAMCGATGIALNQILYYEGLNLTTPMNASIIHTSSPVIVILISVAIGKENINIYKILGIVAGLTGALLLIIYGQSASGPDVPSLHASNIIKGNILVFLNILAYSIYLVIAKPLMKRYHPITVMKWVFIFGFLFAFPFCINQLGTETIIGFSSFTMNTWFSLIFVVLGTTIVAYLMIMWSLKYLQASTVGYYIYTQPLVAGTMAVIVYHEPVTHIKILAALFVFAGVFLINKKS